MKSYIYVCVFLLLNGQAVAQYGLKDSCGSFRLHISGNNLEADSLQFIYADCEQSYKRGNKYPLSGGTGTITGNINRATEGILFTNKRSRLMDGPGVIRFIMEPGEMTVRFTMNERGDTAGDISITGSAAQREKEAWDRAMAPLFLARDSAGKARLDSRFDSIRHAIATNALIYVKKNPQSFFSGYLLYHYNRLLPVDTEKAYFGYLSSLVMSSDFGKKTLNELLLQTDDWAFRRRFSDSTSYRLMREAKTVYDVSLPDAQDGIAHFASFRGEILLIDFWGSWCGPCIRNIPFLRELISDMKGKPVRIVSVSMDDQRDIWKKSLKKYRFPGLQLLDDHKVLSTMYKVIWAPRYVIIAPDGTVVNIDAPQAMDPQLKVLLNQLIKKYQDS